MARTKKPSEETKHQRYEASGKRPGAPVSTRLSEPQLERLDAVRGEESRAAFTNRVLLKAIGWNETANAKPKGKGRK